MLDMKPLLFCSQRVNKGMAIEGGNGGGGAYMIPWKKVAVSAIFCWVSIAKAHTTGIGMVSMTSPSMTLGTLNHFATMPKSTHFPLLMPLSQA